MPTPDAARRPLAQSAPEGFATVTLTIPIEEATRLARMQVDGLETAEATAGRELRTDGGELVAVAASRRLRDGSPGTDLAYRESPADGEAATTGGDIRRAVGPYAR